MIIDSANPCGEKVTQGVFGSPASCLSDSEFLPGWKKYPGVAETMIKPDKPDPAIFREEQRLGVF
ncbi:MAG: hypothetical protein V2B19_00195 [Pseudomonadota bacterium]